MEKSMTPSAVESKTMTDGQINKAVASYRALLEKHSPGFDSTAVQLVLGQPELADDMLVVLRKRVEAVSNIIVRRVKVNRSRTPQKMLVATGRAKYTDRNVVDAMPRGEGEEVEIEFFKLDLTARKDYISDDDLEKEFASRGYSRPADPYELAAVNENDPAFADNHPNGTHWKDSNGNWCYIAFDRWNVERNVYVYRYDGGWDDIWWFAGARK